VKQHTSDQTGVPARPHDTRLHAGAVSVVGVTVQSVGLIGPAIGILLTTPFIVSLAGVSSGLAFLIDGNMAISASGKGGALIRVDPADCDTLAETTTVTVAIMGGREMPGWLRVSSDDLETDEQLTQWVSRAVRYARSLPPKR